MIKINLLPVRAAAKVEKIRLQLSIAALSAVLLAIVIGYLHYTTSSKITERNAEIIEAQKEIDRLKTIIAKVNKFKADSKNLEKKLAVITTLNAGRTGPIHLMAELSDMVPDKLWLESFKESKWMLDMAGLAVDQHTIADFMTNMERSPMFDNVKLKGTALKKSKGLELQKFTIRARFKPPINEEK